MGTRERRARHKQDLRQQILDAARELLVRDGHQNLSMRRVAERIDYSPTAIYLHFKDKQELVYSLCEETFVRLIRELETLPADCPDPLVRLRKGLERYIAFGLKYPNHYVPSFILPPPVTDLDPKQQAAVVSPDAPGMRALGTLSASLADCVKAKKIRKVDPEITARAFWAAIHGMTSVLIVHGHFPWIDRDKVVKTLLDTLIDGVKA